MPIMTSSLTSFTSLIIINLFLLYPIYGFNSRINFQNDVVEEEKIRLGSTPPSCHNKCNQCHPCVAVQVPTLQPTPGGDPVLRPKSEDPVSSSASAGNRYSNYKPLGWKCRCNGDFYNP